jgi:hypothetical protein
VRKIFVVEFEIEVLGESPVAAYSSALEKLGGLVRKQQALGVADSFDEIPNGGIDGVPASDGDGWKCVFSIREKDE